MNYNKYEQMLLNNAIKLDDAIDGNGVIQRCVQEIILDSDQSAIKLCNILFEISAAKDRRTIPLAVEMKDSLIRYYGHKRLIDLCKGPTTNEAVQEEKSLEELLSELNELIGLKKVKEKVLDLIAFQKVQLLRKQVGLSSPKSTLHLAFTGNPGTGKTTVARIIGRIYKQIGLLSKGHFTEVSRTDLIAGYQGQTAHKVKAVIENAKGGVLFIDEAYSITENDHSDSYGRECLTELTKALEDYRDDLVVIVAGYTEPMEKFFESNPGLKSRFNTFIEFDDYSPDELMRIMETMCKKESYFFSEHARTILSESLEKIVKHKEWQFGNGRFIRNVFEERIMRHARRVIQISNPSADALQELKTSDFPPTITNNIEKESSI